LLPADYGDTLKSIQDRVRQVRARVILSANAALVSLYWEIGRIILERQSREGWGAKVVDRLARDLRRSFPEMQGFSPRNLQFMRSFAEEIPDATIVKQLASQLPWWHVVRLMQRVKDPAAREWYMREAARQGWSRRVLELQMLSNAHARQGRAVTNFDSAMTLSESRRAAAVFKDPYVFDFLGVTDINLEREVEQGT
jgi:predicted nuclease of restriction endonuclease-like (RecB) superfamily